LGGIRGAAHTHTHTHTHTHNTWQAITTEVGGHGETSITRERGLRWRGGVWREGDGCCRVIIAVAPPQ
jgi:hypothetical protein